MRKLTAMASAVLAALAVGACTETPNNGMPGTDQPVQGVVDPNRNPAGETGPGPSVGQQEGGKMQGEVGHGPASDESLSGSSAPGDSLSSEKYQNSGSQEPGDDGTSTSRPRGNSK